MLKLLPLEEKGSFYGGGRRSGHSSIVISYSIVSQSSKKSSGRLIECSVSRLHTLKTIMAPLPFSPTMGGESS